MGAEKDLAARVEPVGGCPVVAGRRSGRRVGILAAPLFSGVLIVVSLVAAAASGAAPQGPWVLPATDLSADGGSAGSPHVVTGSDGTTAAVWRRSDGTDYIAQAAVRPPGATSFGAPEDLSDPGEDADNPEIAVGPDGTVTAVWHRYNGSRDIIQAATRTPGSSAFGDPENLSDLTAFASYPPALTIGPDGTTTVIWSSFKSPNVTIVTATRASGASAFGPPMPLSDGSQYDESPQIASGPDGSTIAVWTQDIGSDNTVRVASRAKGASSFGSPQSLTGAGKDGYDPQISIGADGTATVVWRLYDLSHDFIQAATRPNSAAAFGSPEDVSDTSRDDVEPQIAVGPDGTSTAVWRRSDSSDEIVQAATRVKGGNFGAPENLSGAGQDAYGPQVASGPDGDTTAIWDRSDGSDYIVQARTRAGGAPSFGATQDLSAAGENAGAAQITTGPDSRATAVWNRFNGSNFIIQTASTAVPMIGLTVSKSGSGSGKVTSAPAGIDCGGTCSASFSFDAAVTLTATPDQGSTFAGWGGDCEGANGSTCELRLSEDASATAAFQGSTPGQSPKLKVQKVKPKKPKVKRGKKAKIKVTGKNVGTGVANGAKLCLKQTKAVKKALKVKGKKCQKLGNLAAGKAKTKAFKLKSTGKAKKGKKYKLTFKLTAKGAKAANRAVKVKVK
ncbi:MAG: hypothetical protein KDB62_05220 [Solirubrobacterales bacterium]|nr:hypothetical protein [Solirubrobacterales bacterium]